MFVTPAYAQTGSGGGDLFGVLLPFVLIFVIMYFLIIRPQRTRMKQHQEMVAGVRRGDTVVTSGGIIGKVTKVVDDNEVQLEISEGVRIKVVRGTISEVRTKSEPAEPATTS